MAQFGIIGLGKMGGGLALQALEKGFSVAGFDTGPKSEELKAAKLSAATSMADLCGMLSPPRIAFVYVPAGPVVDTVIDDLAGHLSPGDIVVDGGNSYWGDSIRRHARLRQRQIHFLDLGTSGGVTGARNGACFMVGGEDEPVSLVEPILRRLAVEGGYVHAGPPGAGHFTKLVHNGIEFGMLQAIGEGMQLLERYRDALPVANVLHCWRNGSVIRSWLIDLMEEQYRDQGGTGQVPSFVEDTGEVNWLLDDAMHMEVPVPVIAQSIMQLIASRDADKVSARAVALMRHGFGGHPFGPDAHIARERREGRVGGFPPLEQK